LRYPWTILGGSRINKFGAQKRILRERGERERKREREI
jgi:hypothetical protein